MYIGNQVNTNRLNSTLHEHQHFTASQADTVTNAGFYTFTVNSTQNLVVSTSGGRGDLDLYVKAGSKPTTTSYDCRPYSTGNNEQCRVWAQPGVTYHVMLNAYSAYSGVTLKLD